MATPGRAPARREFTSPTQGSHVQITPCPGGTPKLTLMPFVDLHFHLLPGVDDGPAALPEALDLAHAAVADGSGTVVATPHVRHDAVSDVLFIPDLVHEVRAALAGSKIELEVRPGGELDYRLAERLSQRELETIAQGPMGARWLLLETPFEGIGEDFHHAAAELRARGFGILLAHPERSADVILDGAAGLRREVAHGALTQLTAASLLGGHGEEAYWAAVSLLAERLVGLIASDAHGPTRPPALTDARRLLAAEFGDDALAHALTVSAPRRLLVRGIRPRPAPVPRAA